ncbi:type IV toxin-antitoxin system AbiEi family antitoxin [Herbiconiux sp. P15]|uniref:type IV toxin-antitoxin system AbiEi family antitoxin n=1 Tax=Herbiconiux liukaitaii TaxID=3342799 RepID=UPI0035B7612B
MPPPPALPFVLDSRSLPAVELAAARLDGAVRRLGDAFLPLDVRETPALRAATIAHLVPPGLVLERRSAAWLLGAHPHFSLPLQLCVPSTRRIRYQRAAEHMVRQVRVGEAECVGIGGLTTTGPERTALDLVRWEAVFDRAAAMAVSTLLLAAEATPDDAIRRLGCTPHLPHKHRALDRLRSLQQLPTLERYREAGVSRR